MMTTSTTTLLRRNQVIWVLVSLLIVRCSSIETVNIGALLSSEALGEVFTQSVSDGCVGMYVFVGIYVVVVVEHLFIYKNLIV